MGDPIASPRVVLGPERAKDVLYDQPSRVPPRAVAERLDEKASEPVEIVLRLDVTPAGECRGGGRRWIGGEALGFPKEGAFVRLAQKPLGKPQCIRCPKGCHCWGACREGIEGTTGVDDEDGGRL